jgi:SPP1 gp7 family putative phage head morphogenesis protein
MARKPYRIANAAAERITKQISKQFRHNRLALFDEMNIVQTRKHVKRLYKNVYSTVKKEFAEIINPIYQETYNEALEAGFEGDPRDLDESWIEEFFEEYNPVTKYVFNNEIGRKESRLFEALVASKEDKLQSYKASERLLANQIKQYTIELEDAVLLMAYEDAGVRKVRWIAEDDSKTCSDCNELDDQVFDLDDVPPKQHLNCRCYLIPVNE